MHNQMDGIGIMCGSARRKPLQTSLDCQTERKSASKPYLVPQKESYRQSFSKLQIPIRMSRCRRVQAEDPLVSKSCKSLFECLKPYQDPESRGLKRLTREKGNCSRDLMEILRGAESQTTRTCTTTATRKFQFLTIQEESPGFFTGYNIFSSFQSTLTRDVEEFKFLDFTFCQGDTSQIEETVDKGQDFDMDDQITDGQTLGNGKTITSEDFITNVFSSEKN